MHTPQSPIVRTSNYTRFGMDEYPLGTNAVIAVISYTGYDMEDAMIVNKVPLQPRACAPLVAFTFRSG